ncbi:MAG: hypothetical protein AAFY76_17165, partial [Cyanobacteria bacterium J06649_11]
MYRYLTRISLILLATSSLYVYLPGQTDLAPAQSLKDTAAVYALIAKNTFRSDPNYSKLNAVKARTILEDFQQDSIFIAATNSLGLAYFFEGNFSSAKAYLEEASSLSLAKGDSLAAMKSKGNIGMLAISTGRFRIGIEVTNEVAMWFLSIGDSLTYASQ